LFPKFDSVKTESEKAHKGGKDASTFVKFNSSFSLLDLPSYGVFGGPTELFFHGIKQLEALNLITRNALNRNILDWKRPNFAHQYSVFKKDAELVSKSNETFRQADARVKDIIEAEKAGAETRRVEVEKRRAEAKKAETEAKKAEAEAKKAEAEADIAVSDRNLKVRRNEVTQFIWEKIQNFVSRK
jgi:hypothetical protein